MEVLAANEENAGAGINQIECADVTGDGVREAVFTVLSGGTAGPTQFGVITSKGGLLLLEDGYKVAVDVVNERRFDVQQPIYKKSDANCCPSAFRFTKYVWDGERFKPRKGSRYTKPKRRFYETRRGALPSSARAARRSPRSAARRCLSPRAPSGSGWRRSAR